jgi:predicted DNA binding CopG/RHH family protein
MNANDYAAHVLTEAMKAYEAGDKAEAVRLLDVLIEAIKKKRDVIAKEL